MPREILQPRYLPMHEANSVSFLRVNQRLSKADLVSSHSLIAMLDLRSFQFTIKRSTVTKSIYTVSFKVFDEDDFGSECLTHKLESDFESQC